MKYLAILPPYLPVEQIRKTAAQVMDSLEITSDPEAGSSEVEALVVTTFTKVDKDLIDRFPNLKFVQVASTGYDNVDIEYLKKKGIMLSNIPVANKESVAEHVITMALAFQKNLLFFDSEIRNGNWPMLTNSRDLQGKVFGIVGMGAIGLKLAERLLSFGVGLLYTDVRKLPEESEENLGITFTDLDTLLEQSDIVSLHLPLTDDTSRMMNWDRFSKMKDSAIFINTSRGEVVEESALIRAVKEKGIKAGIDVYSQEPPDFSSELFSLDNVIFSPHIAGVTVESQQRFITETVSNVLKYSQGLDPLYRVC